MLANLFFYSMILGLFGILPFHEKYKKAGFLFFVAALSYIVFTFFSGYQDQIVDSFSFSWMRTQKYRIEISINSVDKNYLRLLPVFVMTLLMALGGVLASKTDKADNPYPLMAFNLANMILLISSQNLVQLLTCICVADIITQATIRNFGAAKKYIFYSLFADLGLFMIFAIIQGKLKSFNLDGFVAYKKIGRHKDFVAITALIFIFAKMGLFMFQTALLDLKNIKSYKLISIISLGSVLSSFFVLIKIYPLLQISEYSEPLLNIFIMLSILWGLAGGTVMAAANRQIIFFGMMLYSFGIYIFMQKGVYESEISAFLLLGYLTLFALLINKKYLKIIFRVLLGGAWLAALYFYQIPEDWRYYAFSAAIFSAVMLFGNISRFYRFKKLQEADIFGTLYDILLIKPILILGRGLWILFDFMIMEKHVVGGVAAAGEISAGYIEKIKDSSFSVKLLWFIFWLSLFAASFYFGGIRL